MTQGSEPPINWEQLAPQIVNPTRESIVEAIRWIGPLSIPDLKGILDDPDLQLACVNYHVSGLAQDRVLMKVGKRPVGASIEMIFLLSPPS